MNFEENWDSNIDGTLSLLNDQNDAGFSPRLDLPDQMITSFEINRQVGSSGIIHNRHATTERIAMKSYRQELWFEIPNRRGLVNITPHVRQALAESGVQEGLCLVNAMHITASVFINDDESGLHQDYDDWLEGLAPHAPTGQYRHNRTGEDNADAHLKRQVMGREVVVAVTKGRLDFGPWEQIFYYEFDGRRRKRALIKIIGE